MNYTSLIKGILAYPKFSHPDAKELLDSCVVIDQMCRILKIVSVTRFSSLFMISLACFVGIVCVCAGFV